MNGIELQGVQAKIGTFELKGIDLVVPKGSVLGLLGRNGAGKTTLFKTMNGTYLKQDGLLKIYGKTFEEDEEGIRMNLSIVYDTYNINPLTKGKKLLKYDRIWFPGFDDRLFEQLKKTFKLDPDIRIHKMSLGMQKKWLLSLALAKQPKVLLLDEPMIGIDPMDREVMFKEIQTYMENEDHTLVISSHYVEDVERIADYIAMMNDGKIVLFSEKEALLDRYVAVNLDFENQARTDIIYPVKHAFGYRGIMESRDAKKHGLPLTRPSLEQIFVHLCQPEVA
jgi:ABC-2 type transport system ATP-binding protein